jgi:hypothetical protein
MSPFGQAVGVKMQTLSHVFIIDVIKTDYMETGRVCGLASLILKMPAGTLVLIGL